MLRRVSLLLAGGLTMLAVSGCSIISGLTGETSEEFCSNLKTLMETVTEESTKLQTAAASQDTAAVEASAKKVIEAADATVATAPADIKGDLEKIRDIYQAIADQSGDTSAALSEFATTDYTAVATKLVTRAATCG
jgi:hypothetical protein